MQRNFLFPVWCLLFLLGLFILPVHTLASQGFCHPEDLTSNIHPFFMAGDSYYRRTSQGMCVAGEDLIYTRYDSDSAATTYVVINARTGKEEGHYDFHTLHSNSLTYNPDTSQVVAVSEKHAYVFDFSDHTLSLSRDIVMNHNCPKIAYIPEKHTYYLGTDDTIYETTDFITLTSKFKVNVAGVNQGMGFDGTYLYINWYKVGNNFMALYTTDGKYAGRYNLVSNTWLEVEEVDFLDGTMYVNVSNSGEKNGIYTVHSRHQFGEYVTTKKPTCSLKGTKERECSLCQTKETAPIPATGKHKPGDWSFVSGATCVNDGIAVRRCEVCGQVRQLARIPATGHAYTDWEETNPPTVLTKGFKRRICLNCGDRQYRSVKRLPARATMDYEELGIKLGDSTDCLKATCERGDCVVSYTSDHPKTVFVDNTGTIQAKRLGNATITAVTAGGASVSCKVSVSLFAPDVRELSVSATGMAGEECSIREGTKLPLQVTKLPETATDAVTFKSSDDSVASVSSIGIVTAKKEGHAEITVSCGTIEKNVKIFVRSY